MFDFNILAIIAGIPGLLIALVIHEYAHAQVADWMGDDTPRMMGRLTLNPVAHIDPVGLIMLLVARFGWAKPVMINPGNFRNWRKGEVCVALAGPVSNLITAFVASSSNWYLPNSSSFRRRPCPWCCSSSSCTTSTSPSSTCCPCRPSTLAGPDVLLADGMDV